MVNYGWLIIIFHTHIHILTIMNHHTTHPFTVDFLRENPKEKERPGPEVLAGVWRRDSHGPHQVWGWALRSPSFHGTFKLRMTIYIYIVLYIHIYIYIIYILYIYVISTINLLIYTTL